MKEFKIKYAVLGTLFLILLVPMFNTANLYGNYSSLYGLEKEVVRYFLGISFEIAILVCVLAGYRPASILFSIVSLLIGLLYHINFNDIRYFNSWFEHKFISSVIIQIGISSMVYFLSEIYVLLLKKEKNYNEFIITKTELQRLVEQKNAMEKNVDDFSKNHTEAYNKLMDMFEKKSKMENVYYKLQHDISTLQKQKAGMSRNKHDVKIKEQN